MTYYILDPEGIFNEDKLIKVKPEGITPELKELAEAAAQREHLKEVAVIFFHTSGCSPNQMAECMATWLKVFGTDSCLS